MANKIYDAELQYLLVEQAKYLGLTEDDRVVGISENADYLRHEGIRPLLVYSIVAPAYRCQTRMLVDADEPISISAFLAQVWTKGRLIGVPLALEMKPGLLAADLGFVNWANSVNVRCAAAASIHAIGAYSASIQGFEADFFRMPRLSDANKLLAECHIRAIEDMANGSFPMNHADRSTFIAWLNRGQRHLQGHKGLKHDWDSSVARIPKAPIRTTFADPTWHDEDILGLPETVAMWPRGPQEFCGRLGLRFGELRAWIDRRSPIEMEQYEELEGILHIDELFFGTPQLMGGCLLIADTPDNVIELYQVITNSGGDVLYSFEATSPTTAFHGYRVLLFEGEETQLTIILFKRGGAAEQALSRNELPGFTGPVAVPREMAEDLDRLIGDLENLAEPGHAGCALADRHRHWLLTHQERNDEEARAALDGAETGHLHLAAEMITAHWAHHTEVTHKVRRFLANNPSEEAL